MKYGGFLSTACHWGGGGGEVAVIEVGGMAILHNVLVCL